MPEQEPIEDILYSRFRMREILEPNIKRKRRILLATINNLITNGGFETGNLSGWVSTNAAVTSVNSHSNRYSATFINGNAPATISQDVPVDPGQNYQLFVSLSKYGFLSSPEVNIRVAFLDGNGTEVANGLFVDIPAGSVPNQLTEGWKEIYQVSSIAPDNATQARVEITKQRGAFFTSNLLIDDVALLAFETGVTVPPGPTGPTA